jgi:fucose permease
MKLSFAHYISAALVSRKRGASHIISAVVIGFFAGMVGSYLLANTLWTLVLALASVAGIFLCLGGAASNLLNRNKSHPVSGAPVKKKVLGIRSISKG